MSVDRPDLIIVIADESRGVPMVFVKRQRVFVSGSGYRLGASRIGRRSGTELTAVTGGVDTHSLTHHAAALDEVGRLLGTKEFPADDAGYAELLDWLRSFGTIREIGVEAPAPTGPA